MTHIQSLISNRRQALRWLVILATVIPIVALVAGRVASAEEDINVITSFEDRIPPPHTVTARDIIPVQQVDPQLFVDWRLGSFSSIAIEGLGSLHLDSFTVERRELTAFGASFWQPLAREVIGTGHTSSKPMQSGRTYQFRVAAYFINDSGDITYIYKSPYSEPGSYTAPTVPAPTGLTVTTADNGLSLSWTAPEPYDSDIFSLTGYIVLKSTIEAEDDPHPRGSAIGVERIAVSGTDTTTYLDESTVDTKRYSYRILAVYNYVHSRTSGHGLSFIPGVGEN